jgi:hypothetical protein
MSNAATLGTLSQGNIVTVADIFDGIFIINIASANTAMQF